MTTRNDEPATASVESERLREAGRAVDAVGERVRARLRRRMFSAAPERVGRFPLLGKIGEGGMGIVFAAYDPELDRKIAIKLLHNDPGTGNDERHRLVREAQALAQVSHPNVVSVFEVGVDGERVFVGMEYVSGLSLKAWQRTETRGWREIVSMYVQAGEGLAAAHAAGIVHRDFKPSNVLLDADGRPRVLDFGLARFLEGASPRTEGSSRQAATHASHEGFSTASQSFPLAGTPPYMAPEQALQRPVDARSDQFSFCVALFEALFGIRPHPGRTPSEILQSIATGTMLPFPSSPRLPRALRKAIQRGLSTAPGDRHHDMQALLAVLRRVSVRPRRLGIVAAGVGVAGLAWAWQALSPACDDGVLHPLRKTWNAARKAEIQQRFESAEAANAETSSAFVERVDHWTLEWAHARQDACEAHRIRRDESAQLHDLRVACLERQLGHAQALLEAVSEADLERLGALSVAAWRLPGLEVCADVENLHFGPGLPPHELEPEIGATRRMIARAAVEALAGHPATAAGLAEAAVLNATRIGYAPLLADAQYEAGRARLVLGDPTAAEWLASAIDTAESSRNEITAARSWIALALAHTRWERKELAGEALRRAETAVARQRAPKEIDAAMRLARAEVREAEGDTRGALEDLEAARRLLVELHGANYPSALEDSGGLALR